jgi:hypothetical protein
MHIWQKMSKFKILCDNGGNSSYSKLDAPSGTTISRRCYQNSSYTNWTLENQGNRRQRTGKTNSNRSKKIGTVQEPTVTYNSEVDAIEIKHTAHNREGFALGAVIAAEWIVGKQGVFYNKDVLELDINFHIDRFLEIIKRSNFTEINNSLVK